MAIMTPSRSRNQSNSKRLSDLFNENWRWTILFSVPFAVSLSLFVFVRFLNFYLTPTVNKGIVFAALFIFFYLLSLFFLTPLVNGWVKRPKAMAIVLAVSLALTALLHFVLPAQKFTIRTVHSLRVAVASESQPVIFENFTDPSQAMIPWEDVTTDGEINADAVWLSPGEGLDYAREMTGSVSFMVSAPEGDAELSILWDGSEQAIELSQGESRTLIMDPTSTRNSSRVGRIILLIIKVNEWFGLFLILSIALGGLVLLLWPDGYRYDIYQRKAQGYLTDYLILAGVLLLVAIGLRAFRSQSVTVTTIVLLPALAYLALKLVYYVVPSLPLVLLILTLGVNILAHWVWFDQSLLAVRPLPEKTFSELTKIVNPNDATFMSIGFYKPLRGSDLIVPAGSFLAEETNVARLERINLHESVEVLDYPGELTAEVFQQVMTHNGWGEWTRREDGAFYFYMPELPVTAPVVVFTFRDNVLLIPANLLDELELTDVFVLD
jgi:hypothetical protein